MNENSNTPHARAYALFQANRLDEALSVYRRICAENPADIDAWHMAGAIAGMLGDNTTAKDCCERVVALNPAAHGPYLNLGNVLLAMGRHEDAMVRFQQALKIKPDDPQILTNLSNLYCETGKPDEAIRHLKAAIQFNPAFPEAHNNLGVVYRKTGDLTTAESCLRKALALRPDYIDALCNLGAVLIDKLEPDKAEVCYKEALRIDPGNHPALRSYGNLYQSKGQYDEAEECYMRALSRSPADTETISSLASLYERLGNYDAALKSLMPLISSDRYNAGIAITFAAISRKIDRREEAIVLLNNLLDTPVTQNDKANIHFSLGELYDDKRDYKQAFENFQAGNDIDEIDQKPEEYEPFFSLLTRFFTRDRMEKLPRATNTSRLPVFIVGMPRSGTSLVEQILASHNSVQPGGERGDIANIVESLIGHSGPGDTYPSLLDTINAEQIDKLANDYLDVIRKLSGTCTLFTDKTPFHGMHLGFINMLLPGSRIIVCNRNPVDICLSIYFHRFNDAHRYASSLKQLGKFYRHYVKLMEDLIPVLDIDVLQVQYEDMVNNSERNIHDIIDFCGLEWQSGCLSFYKNKRIVNTPSYDQVRQPIYSSSVGRWKNYAQYLEPLLHSLEGTEE